MNNDDFHGQINLKILQALPSMRNNNNNNASYSIVGYCKSIVAIENERYFICGFFLYPF